MAKAVLKPGKDQRKKPLGENNNPRKIKKGPVEAPKKKFVQKNKEVSKKVKWDFIHTIAFWGLAALLFLPPYFRGLFFAPEQEKALVFAAVIFWFAYLWKWLSRNHSFLSHPFDYFVLAFPAVYLVSAFQAANHGLAVDEIVKTTLYFMVYWLTSRLVRGDKEVVTLLHVIYISAIGVALAGLATATGLIQIKDGFLSGRIYSTFQYPNALASYLAAVTFMGLYLWRRAVTHEPGGAASFIDWLPDWQCYSGLKPYLYAAGNFLLFAVLLGTKSNGGLLVFSFTLLLYLIGLPKGNRIPVFLHLVLFIVPSFAAIWCFLSRVAGGQPSLAWLWIMIGLALALLGQYLYSIIERKGLLDWIAVHKKAVLAGVLLIVIAGSIGAGIFVSGHGEAVKALAEEIRLRNATERIYFFQDAVKMFKERPVLGWGGGGWEEAYRAYQGYLYNSNQVHGHYFQIMVETGILGLLVILGIWFSFLLLTHRLYHGAKEDPGRRLLVWTITVACISIGLHAAIDFDLSLSALAIVLWAMFGVARGIGIYSEIKEETKKSKPYVPVNYVPLLVVSVVLLMVVVISGTLAMADSYSKQVSTAFQKQDYNKGLALRQKATSYNPFNANYHSNLALIYMQSGMLEQGAVEAQKAVKMSQYNAQRYADLANIEYSLKNNEKALKHAEKALSLAPFQIQWYETLARSYFVVGYNELTGGKRDEAKKHLEMAVGVPARIEAKMSGLGETEKKLWVVAPPMSTTSLVNLSVGSSQYLLGHLTEADVCLQMAFQDEKTKGEAALWLALIREQQGLAQDAQDYLSQAQTLIPEMAKGYEGLRSFQTLD